jgi:uncharacterized damage-inducible protein DinB
MKANIQHYVSSFESLYEGEPWYGRSIVSIVKEVQPTQAFKKNSPTSHSIYEIVGHMLAWRDLFVKRLNGDYSSTIQSNSESDWPKVPGEKNASSWDQLLHKLSENQQALIHALKKVSDNQLDKDFAKTNATLETHLEGNLQHDIYHLGQIAVLNK